MAEDAFGPGMDAVIHRVAAGPPRLADAIVRVVPSGIGQDGVGLVVVPDVGIRPPGVVLEVEDLGLHPTTGAVSRSRLTRRCGPGPSLGEPPVALVIEPDTALAGHRQEPLGRRAVGPELGVDRVRDHAGGRPMLAGRGEEARLAQPPGKSLFPLAAGLRTRR